MNSCKALSPLILIFIALSTAGCIDEIQQFTDIPERHQIYSVYPEGTHVAGITSNGHNFIPHFTVTNYPSDELRFKAKLHSNTLYTEADLGNYNQVNKLFGFTDCNSADPQENSARFGWIAIDGKMKVLPYVDKASDTKRPHQYDLNEALVIELDRYYTYEIKISGREYIFTVSDSGTVLMKQTMNRNCSSTVFKNILSPYFGGREKAPHRMDVEIELL